MGQPLPPDREGEFETDLAAMRRDAQVWDRAAQRMGDAASTAQGLTLSGYDLSMFADRTGLTEAYQEIQQWAAGLLRGAHQNLANMNQALRTMADNYETTDTGQAQTFDKIQPGGN